MLLAIAVTLWFVCGLLATYVAFAVARRHRDIFDPIHVWLAVLGPIGLLFTCLTLASRSQDQTTA